CCINKTNNTELGEAISSMGDWYKNAQICMVYLNDYIESTLERHLLQKVNEERPRWATRGWSLQEIVISQQATFYNSAWDVINITESSDSVVLEDRLATICGVPVSLICCGGEPNVGAALILQLASKRNTSRPEDRAYSLMGMLGVRMRADYGEGQAKAVSRLFECILSANGDVSVFNW
ncbi:hypothetical protein K440DRAFT_463148, partial [Wilcoxina mikolae CBS 423.85]